MALVSEAGFRFDGRVRKVNFDKGDDGNRYATVQVENTFGISDIRFSADDTATLAVKDGDEVSWIVRPSCYSGTSKAGRSYAFLSLRFVQDAALAL